MAPTVAAISTVAWLGHRLRADTVARAAVANAVEAVPLSQFVLKGSRPEGRVLGFAPYDRRQIEDGVTRLARALDRASVGRRDRQI